MNTSKRLRASNTHKFDGLHSEERTMSAMPIRIDYQSPRDFYICEAVADDFLFRPPSHTGEMGIDKKLVAAALEKNDNRESFHALIIEAGYRETAPLNAYAIRDAFDAVEDPTAALTFLSEGGAFWPWRAVRWSQFQEWQRFFRWLRMNPEQAIQSPEGAKAWSTAEGWGNKFFTNPPGEPRQRPNYMTNTERQLCELYRFSIRPERLHGHCLSIEWRSYGDASFKPCPPSPKFKGKEQQPYLRIEAHNIAEAIAATIYADRCSGIRYARCKECGKLFRVESEHGQEFCPPPSTIKTSACKNRWTQRERRNREREAKASAKLKAAPSA